MAREPHRRRPGRAASSVSTANGTGTSPFDSAQGSPEQSLVSLLAHTTKPSDLLPQLHQHAIEVTGGASALLFQYNPRNGMLQPTSAFRLDELQTEPWQPTPSEAALVDNAFERRMPVLVTDADGLIPDLAARLNTRSVLLIPLASVADRIGLLAIGYAAAPSTTDIGPEIVEVGDAFVAALIMFRFRLSEQLQRDVRLLLDEFSATLSSTLSLAAGLDIFCFGANRLFGADRTSVWIHERRAHDVVLQASSDSAHIARGVRVNTDDPLAPAAVALRQTRAEIASSSADAATVTVTVPLRGCRRALGTLLFEGVRLETGGELDLLDRADEVGGQLSHAIENLQLIDDVMRSRRELENAFDSITHLIAVSDRRGHIVHVNEPFAARVGRSRDDLVDLPLNEFVGPELAAWFDEHAKATPGSNDESTSTREIADPVLNGPFMATITDLLNNDRQHVGSVIVLRDLTPHTKLEAEREALRKRLTQAEKLAALGQFVAGIAHELNNPLQGVLGHIELLRTTGAFPKQLRREVQTIYREAERAAKIVRNLLVFAGSRRLSRRPVSVNAILQKVLALRAAACRAADIEVVRHYDEHLPRVESDPLLLHQVFLNMVMNAEHAVTATRRGGRIEVTTALNRTGDRIIATVRDTGTGIPDDALSRIFEPFYTTKEVGKGTGLGLAIAYGIVQEHGGHISAANHRDGGAVFTVELPTAAAAGR
jgi:PAS domain S-box-containing protein